MNTPKKPASSEALTRKQVNTLIKAQQAYVWAVRKVVKGTTYYPDNTKQKTVHEQVAENESVIRTINEWVVTKC
jgi:glutamine amidotransferase PdxT